jgi:D-alanine-D-alanine ligase
MNAKTQPTVAVVMGGYGPEWEISIKSGKNVCKALEGFPLRVIPVVIRPEGWWAEVNLKNYPINRGDFSFDVSGGSWRFDAVFNALHGTPGEDGLLQAYFQLLDIPHTSCSAFAAALTFNKAECNVLLKGMGFRTPDAINYHYGAPLDIPETITKLGLPLFIKPSRSGSSFGVSKVKTLEAFQPALDFAAKEDHHILIEGLLKGTEVSCGVLKIGQQVRAIAVTEIVPEGEFFDYQAKYEGKSQEITPARISEKAYAEVCATAVEVFTKLDLSGLVRIDFFVSPEDVVTLVEINSVPGLSDASIIPHQLRYMNMDAGQCFYDLIVESIQNKKQ